MKIVTNSGLTLGSAFGYVPPVTKGYIGAWFLGSEDEYARKNQKNGAADGEVSGDLTHDDHFTSFVNSSIDTGIAQAEEMTIICVCKSDDANDSIGARPQWISNRQGVSALDAGRTALGLRLEAASTTQVRAVSSYWNTNTLAPNDLIATITPADINDWMALALRVDQRAAIDATSQKISIDSLTDDLSDSDNNVVGKTPEASLENMRIGANVQNTAGDGSVAMAVFYNRWLSDAELANVYANLKTLLATVSIAI